MVARARQARHPPYDGDVGAGVGLVVRMVFLVLTPTLYGVRNNLLFMDNDLFGPGFDGWATLIAAVAGVGAFVITSLLTTSKDDEELDLLELDRTESDGRYVVPVRLRARAGALLLRVRDRAAPAAEQAG